MKNKTLSGMAAAAFLLFAFVMAPSATRAQNLCAGSVIDNQTACAITVSYRMMCTPTGVICSFAGPFVIPPATTFPVPACGCLGPNQCYLAVVLSDVGGNAVTPQAYVDPNMPSATYPVAFCPGATGNVVWVPGGVKIQ